MCKTDAGIQSPVLVHFAVALVVWVVEQLGSSEGGRVVFRELCAPWLPVGALGLVCADFFVFVPTVGAQLRHLVWVALDFDAADVVRQVPGFNLWDLVFVCRYLGWPHGLDASEISMFVHRGLATRGNFGGIVAVVLSYVALLVATCIRIRITFIISMFPELRPGKWFQRHPLIIATCFFSLDVT